MRSPKLVLPSLTLIAGCCAFVAKPLHRPSASSTLGNTSNSNPYRWKKEYRNAVNPRRIKSRIYSVPYLPKIDEGGDGSFFLNASQQAAKDRYEMLKQGKDPLAISLSTASIKEDISQQNESINVDESIQLNESSDDDDSNNTDTASTLTLEKDDYNDFLTSLSDSPMAEETTGASSAVQKPSKSTVDEIKRVENEIAAVKRQINARMNTDSEKRAGEGSTAEEMEATRNARLAAADKIKKILEGEKQLEDAMGTSSTDSASITNAGEGSTAEEMEEARNLRLAAADEIANKLKQTAESSKVAAHTIEEETKDELKTASEVEAQQESSSEPVSVGKEENTNKSKLSSDGKAIYEPSQSQLEMNQENVQNGLMVLTRSFLVLNSVVDRLTEDKK